MADASLSRRTVFKGVVASGVLAALPWEVTSAPAGRGLTIRTRRMRRAAGIQRIVKATLRGPGFAALVDQVGVRAVLARFFRGMYEMEAWAATLDRLEARVAQRGWPAAIALMTRLGGVQLGRPQRKLSEAHRRVALTRLEQTTRLWRAVADRNPSAADVLHAFTALTESSRPLVQTQAGLRLRAATAMAQDGGELSFDLPAIVVTPNPVGGTTFVDTTYGTGSISASGVNVDGSVSSVNVVGSGLQSFQISQILNGYWYALFGNTATA